MAQSLRRPLSSVVGLSSSLQRRPFTQSSPQWVGMRSQQFARPAQKAEKSLKVLQKEQMSKGLLPSDMGLLQETFVTPLHNPSLFRTPRKFIRAQYFRVRFRLRDFFASMAFKISSPRGKRWYNRSVQIARAKITPEAVELHKEMYAAFADGDISALRSICTDGIFDSFRARIGGRQRGERVKWELLKYNRKSRVVSDRWATMPGTDGNALRQAVVRICSRQKLTRHVGAVMIEGTGVEKDVVEYVVVQAKVEKWKVGDWMVWGTTSETMLSDCERWRRVAKGEVVSL